VAIGKTDDFRGELFRLSCAAKGSGERQNTVVAISFNREVFRKQSYSSDAMSEPEQSFGLCCRNVAAASGVKLNSLSCIFMD